MAFKSEEWFRSLTPEAINTMTRKEIESVLRQDGGRASRQLRGSIGAFERRGLEKPAWLDTVENAQASRLSSWQSEPWKYKETDTIGALRGKLKQLKNFYVADRNTFSGVQTQIEDFAKKFVKATGSELSGENILQKYRNSYEFFSLYKKVVANMGWSKEEEGRGSWQVMRAVNDVIELGANNVYDEDDIVAMISTEVRRNAEAIEAKRISETPQTSDFFDPSDNNDD